MIVMRRLALLTATSPRSLHGPRAPRRAARAARVAAAPLSRLLLAAKPARTLRRSATATSTTVPSTAQLAFGPSTARAQSLAARVSSRARALLTLLRPTVVLRARTSWKRATAMHTRAPRTVLSVSSLPGPRAPSRAVLAPRSAPARALNLLSAARRARTLQKRVSATAMHALSTVSTPPSALGLRAVSHAAQACKLVCARLHSLSTVERLARTTRKLVHVVRPARYIALPPRSLPGPRAPNRVVRARRAAAAPSRPMHSTAATCALTSRRRVTAMNSRVPSTAAPAALELGPCVPCLVVLARSAAAVSTLHPSMVA